MKATFRFPSKVPYGYVEAEFDTFDDAESIARHYAQEYTKYKNAEADELLKVGQGKPTRLDDSDQDAADLMKEMLGAVEIDESTPAKPWEQDYEDVPAPWEAPSGADWDFS